MSANKRWSKEEEETLSENWGTISIKAIASRLERSENAIIIKAQKLNLGPFLESGEYITFNTFLDAIGTRKSYSYKMISWVENRGLPVRTKRVNNNSFKVIKIDEFWKWADKNRSFIDLSNLEENIFGKEPEWVKEKRKLDKIKNSKIKLTPWTESEDNMLRALLKTYRYGYKELSQKLHRSDGAIQRRICDLGLMERPIKADNHIKWQESEIDTVRQLIKKGANYINISDAVGKSEKACRGLIYRMCKTEVLDKARKII